MDLRFPEDRSESESELTAQQWLEQGQEELRQSAPGNAVDCLTAALALDADLVEARVALGLAQAQMGDFELAAASLERALGTDPGNRKARYLLAKTLQQQGDTERAKRELLETLRRDPSYKPAREALRSLEPSLVAGLPEEDPDVLCHCPKCGTALRRSAPTAICALCGWNGTAVSRGWAVMERGLKGEETLLCVGCRKPVLDLGGACPSCYLSFVTGRRALPQEAAGDNRLAHLDAGEGRSLDWPPEALAPFWRRGAAYVVDIMGVSVFGFFFDALVGIPPMLWWINWMVYETILVAWRTQTLGKWFVGANVEGADGSDVTLARSFGRACAKWLPAAVQSLIFYQLWRKDLTYAFITLWPPVTCFLALFTRHKQALHDLLAGTVVTV
ncbi:MAG TPA: tetratricopeptide repeat protein [Armatimonadota bacterium]|jgi:uncharacterized RDD family membrane protein YckC